MPPADVRPRVDVEVLERALGWTRGVLAGIDDDEAGRSTPCTAWTLTDLLVHMVDALSVVMELSLGRLSLAAPPARADRLARSLALARTIIKWVLLH